MDNIILIGMPGSGKSTVGVLLAKALGYDFLDADLVIQQREGMLLQEILDRKGLDYFLVAEEQAILSLDCRHTVIAPGGSAICRPAEAEHLKSLGTVVYLRVSEEELTRRITNMSSRGIAMKPGQTLADVLAYRTPLYEKYADLTVDCTAEMSLGQTMQAVRELLEQHDLAQF